MLRLTLLATILLAFTTAAQPDPDCDEPAADFDDWFTTEHADLLATEESVLASSPGWADLYDDFADYVLDFASDCADPNIDLAYEGEFDGGGEWLNEYDVNPSVEPVDINLDGVDDWLLRLRVGLVGPNGGQVFVRLLHWHDEEWVMADIWDRERFDLTGGFPEPQPVGVYLHEQADTQGRTYMGIHFQPGIGTFLHVGGLSVLRWDEWQPEEVLFIEQECVFGPWRRGEDGGLYIPTSSAVPWEGCTAPTYQPGQGIQIPGAQMPEVE